ncbi:MAG: crossover junction endodeoxyribonuclease RuvC [Clostridiales bacterium]|nr:crossover junction endodeoxyribonuclease RuvC [Clostridiales bacterium]
MTILGVDPGIATVGFGVLNADRNSLKVVKYGAITTQPGLPLASRLLVIERDLTSIIGMFSPDAVCVEELFFNTNATTGISVAHGRGVILLTAAKCGVPVFEYTPLQVKQAVVGYGRAEKQQVMDMTRRLLKLQSVPRPDDAADALAIAICHARSSTSLLREYM